MKGQYALFDAEAVRDVLTNEKELLRTLFYKVQICWVIAVNQLWVYDAFRVRRQLL
jgi:hypothetical protein